MKKVLKNVSFVILLLRMCIIFGQETGIKKRIVIDVGHGGKDSGAIGINGIKEKDVVSDIGLEIIMLNEMSETPLDIYLTRYSDTLISLSDRTKLAKSLNADLFIVIIQIIRRLEGLRYMLTRTNQEIQRGLFGLPINCRTKLKSN